MKDWFFEMNEEEKKKKKKKKKKRRPSYHSSSSPQVSLASFIQRILPGSCNSVFLTPVSGNSRHAWPTSMQDDKPSVRPPRKWRPSVLSERVSLGPVPVLKEIGLHARLIIGLQCRGGLKAVFFFWSTGDVSDPTSFLPAKTLLNITCKLRIKKTISLERRERDPSGLLEEDDDDDLRRSDPFIFFLASAPPKIVVAIVIVIVIIIGI
ncbi:hypothetical protein L249_0793 [Ophiocordyceps polyrhachis-furcata BCC 54312]|uniref:Uncharacterized protein n=1 Tax=Ophiocordyceps polyrhachis-furcata BCC 54312 TaxID=1330021 RepID=A0A367LG09_9HYPO|nr:hypothetical protein L249_0793 [Ophiocordyceps polyrhachis-furcata BCC 54312]